MPRYKKIPNSALIGERGITLIKDIVLTMGYLWHPTTSTLEAGVDGIIELCEPTTGQPLNQIIQVQSKAFSTLPNETADSFTYYCKKRDLDYWLEGNAPVILIVSRPASRDAYWVPIKQYFQDTSRRAGSAVRFSKATDRFDERAEERLRNLAVPSDTGIYLAPTPKQELLYANLVPIGLPPSIYIGRTDLRRPWQVYEAAKRAGTSIGPEWYLTRKTILSFYDLGEGPWRQVCDQGTVEEHQTTEWSETKDEGRCNELTALLNQTIRGKLRRANVEYHDRYEYYYVLPTKDLSARRVKYRSLNRDARRVIFRAYMSKKYPERVSYYRHAALVTQLYQFNTDWYLALTPTYHYTRDGYRASRYRDENLKGIKRLERNAAVLGQVLMWASILAGGQDLFAVTHPGVTFGPPSDVKLSCGLDDTEWLPNESEDARNVLDMEDNNTRLF